MRTRLLTTLVLACCCALASAAAAAKDPERATGVGETVGPERISPPYRVFRSADPIVVDGVLDEPAWQEAEVWNRFWEYFPGENVAPPVPTEGWVTYDDEHLYIAVYAYDPEPTKIRAHLMDRDEIDTLVQDDHLQILIDTFDDQRQAVHLRVNPLGVQADAINTSTAEDWSWDIIWRSAGRIVEDGWIVEIAVPLNQLSFPRSSGELTFAIELGRSWPRDQRHRFTSHTTTYDSSCAYCDLNKVTGFEGLRPGMSLELDPTVTVARTDRRRPFSEGDFESGDEEVEPGLSGRWGITKSTNLSFAVNPDFSQVEADAAQLDVNERFALFFPEKRPFFLQGVDVFATPINAVFTRTVVDPDWGLKVNGKEGKNAYGVFVTRDSVNNLLLPSNQGSAVTSSLGGGFDDDVLGAVLRYRRDLGVNSTVGVLYAGRESDDYENAVYGVDGTFTFGGADRLTFQLLESETEYPESVRLLQSLDESEISGEAFRLSYSHNTREWFWQATLDQRDEHFRADSGFVPRVDLRSLGGNVERRWWLEDRFLTAVTVGGNASRTEDLSGQVTDQKLGLDTFLRGPRQSELYLQTWTIDRFAGTSLFEDLVGGEVWFTVQPTGSLRLTWYSSWEEAVDFANVREADLLQVNPTIQLKLGRRTNLRLNHFRRSFDQGEGTYLRADLTELRLVYHFGLRMFVRAIVQRTAVDFDPSQFVAPVPEETEDVFSQLLFAYKLNAQTVLFAGYSDNREGDDGLSLTQRDRSYFLKIGYAWLE